MNDSEEEFPLTDKEFRIISPLIIHSASLCNIIIDDLYKETSTLVNENKSVFVVLALLAEINAEVFNRMLGKESSIEEVLDKFCEKLRELVIGA